MKHILSIIALFLFGMSGWLHAQAPNCGDASLSSFCNGIAQYPANFDGTGAGSGPQASAGPNYDCLGTQGNPSFFSLTIDQTGSIDFILDNSSNLDIDFILWGPYNNINAAQLACDSMGQGGIWGGVTDCSYSVSSQEPVSIPSAVSGQVYILMVTNFTNTATNIFSTLNTGTGSVACPCSIPFSIDTLPAAVGNMGYLTDTTNGLNQFVVCPNNTLGFRLSAKGNLNDTLDLYAPFTTVNNVFLNNNIIPVNPGAPTSFDSLDIFGLITPTLDEIGVRDFTLGLRNSIFTGVFSDSTCFDFLNVQVIVPGVKVTDRMVCPGEQFQIIVDSIPTTTIGSSVYNWRQLSGIPVTFSSTTDQNPMVTIPAASSSSSNDSIVLVVDYNYGGLCPMMDTMVLRFSDLTMTATALPDSICAGTTSALDVIFSDSLTTPICNDYEVASIPFAPIAGTGTQVSTFTISSDDGISAALPIGFSFNFFCNTYTQFVMSTNGFISFDLNALNGCCSGDLIPDNFGPNNLIALAWEDLNLTGDALEYFTVGTAPNRILVVNYATVSHHPTPNNQPITVQALLYETSNVIEIHTTSQPDPLGIHTQGIENADGTLGFATPGRNAQTWTATNDAYRFSPRRNGPFYTWTPAASLNSNTARSPIATPNATTNYVVEATDGTCIYTDTVDVTVISNFPTPIVVCDSTGLNSISFSWSDIGLPVTGFYEYSLDSGFTWVNVGAVFSTTVSGLMSNTAYNVLVRGNSGAAGACPISASGANTCSTINPTCLSNPAIAITLTPINLLCNGDSTGCITPVVTGGSGNNKWGFSWSSGQTDSLICNLPAGNYSLTVTDTISSMTPPTTTLLYEEAFDGVNNWTLNVPTGTNGADNNFWTVSSDEAGQAVGACGAAGGPNQSLHITSTSLFATGAAYDAGGLCPFLSCPETNMRAESPAFSSIGSNNISLDFNYIAGGDGLVDNAVVWYNDGSGWQVLNTSIKSTTCAGGQGLWTRFSATLPASCDNQPAIQIGIEWTNNDDGVGTDPSVAIDSVVVSALQAGATSFVCVDSQTITITEPSAVVLTIDSTGNPSCDGAGDGFIATTATGGASGYLYTWNNAATTDSLTGLNAGTYTVTVVDMNGCTTVDSVTLTVPNPIIVTVDSSTSPACSGGMDGSIYISVTGGNGGYTYNWDTGGTGDSLINISDATYTVTITDANGCSITNSTTLAAASTIVIAVDSVGNPSCSGNTDGSIAISVTGGAGGYTYNWSNNATTDSITGLMDGTYTVTVTDMNGCTMTDQVVLAAPNPIVFTVDSFANPTCNGSADGFIATSTTGGSPTYTYSWSNTATTPSVTGLIANTYEVTVTDINGCSITDQVILTEPNLLILTIDSTLNPTCNGSADGYIAVSATGGTAGYSYLWNTGDTTATLLNLNDGTFMVTVTDTNNCVASGQVILNVPNPIVATITAVVNNSCAGQADGSIDVTALGGLGGLSYLWSNGATTQDLSAVSDGIYTLTVSDVNGCFVTVQDTIVPTVILTISDSVETGCAGDPIVVRLTTGGGSSTYNYNWGTSSSSLTDTAQFNLAAGTALTVYVTVSDVVNGCTIIDTIDLQGVAPVVVNLDNVQDIPCGFTALGRINITTTGGTTPYAYAWSDGSIASSLSSATPGTFSVTVTDDNGCTATAGPFTLNQALAADVRVDTINLVTACDGQPTGALIARSNDPTTTFAWSNNSTDSSISNLAAGPYTVVATNSFGCVDSVRVEIIAPTLPTLNASVQTAGTRQVSVPLSTSVTLIAGSSSFDYLWTSLADPVTGNATIANPTLATTTATPDPAGDYWYIVTASATTNDTVCSISDTVMVTVEEPFNGIPNAFTPNDDDINDFFRPTFLADEEVTSFRVFNRWGQMVYNGDENHGEGWDGTFQGVPQPTEVYIYIITYKRASEPDAREVKGEVTLIR